jgi:hypothetical protein
MGFRHYSDFIIHCLLYFLCFSVFCSSLCSSVLLFCVVTVDADELIISFLGSVKRKDIALRFVCIKNMKNGEN